MCPLACECMADQVEMYFGAYPELVKEENLMLYLC